MTRQQLIKFQGLSTEDYKRTTDRRGMMHVYEIVLPLQTTPIEEHLEQDLALLHLINFVGVEVAEGKPFAHFDVVAASKTAAVLKIINAVLLVESLDIGLNDILSPTLVELNEL